MADERTDEEIYPGGKHAYDFVMPSYQLLTVRVESAVGESGLDDVCRNDEPRHAFDALLVKLGH
jgi:hypothetical protein